MSNGTQIDSGIPLPPPKQSTNRKGGRARKYPLPSMKPGDSFFVPETDGRDVDAIRGSLGAGICRMKNANPGFDYATRVWDEQGVRGIRVWRTA